MSHEVAITNRGPIKSIRFKLEEPGVTLAVGRNDKGKSILLDTLKKASAKDGSMQPTDNAGKGTVEAFGITAKFGKSTRYSGELEIESLSSRCDLAALVDPGLKSEEAADRARIKALVGLTGVEAKAELFTSHATIGPAIEEADIEVEGADLVDMAARIKRALDREALAKEKDAATLADSAKALRQMSADVKEPEIDSATAQAAHTEAVATHRAIETRFTDAQKSEKDREESREKLAKIVAEYNGPSVADAKAAKEVACQNLEESGNRVAEIERELEEAKSVWKNADNRATLTSDQYKQAVNHSAQVEAIQGILEAPAVSITEQDVEEAAGAVALAQQVYDDAKAFERVTLERKAADGKEAESKANARAAKMLRDAANATDSVLSSAINCEQLKIVTKDGVQRILAVGHERGDNALYHELSQGARWRIAINIGASAVGKGGILVIPQEAWESLDCFVQREIDEHATELGVYIIAAEAIRDFAEADEMAANGEDIHVRRYAAAK